MPTTQPHRHDFGPDVEVEVIVRITDRRPGNHPLAEDDHHRMCFAASRLRDPDERDAATADAVRGALGEAGQRAVAHIVRAYPEPQR